MTQEKKFLVDVGISGVPFPMYVSSRENSQEGQHTIATISINARIMQEFEARWIDAFIEILHSHRDRIGTKTLAANIVDYLKKLKATAVRVDFEYPFFIEKQTPVSKDKCLVQYLCAYSAKVSSLDEKPKIFQKIEVPAITTYPASIPETPGGLFGQLSVVLIEFEAKKDVYPEDIVDIVDRQALVPVYSFLTQEDQAYVIQKIHSEKKSSVVMLDGIKEEIGKNSAISWYSVRASNYGMLHTYNTVVATEKSMWVPFSGFDEEL